MLIKVFFFFFFQNEEQAESIDAQVVKQAVVQAIKNWSGSTEQD
jgi:hypothetical protein